MLAFRVEIVIPQTTKAWIALLGLIVSSQRHRITNIVTVRCWVAARDHSSVTLPHGSHGSSDRLQRGNITIIVSADPPSDRVLHHRPMGLVWRLANDPRRRRHGHNRG